MPASENQLFIFEKQCDAIQWNSMQYFWLQSMFINFLQRETMIEFLQEAEDRELPLIPLVFDILKTPAVW